MDIGTELRWILIIVGLVVLAGIYLLGRRKRDKGAQEGGLLHAQRAEPLVYDPVLTEEDASLDELEPIAASPPVEESEETAFEIRSEDQPDSLNRREPLVSADESDLTTPLPVNPTATTTSSPLPPRREAPVVTTSIDTQETAAAAQPRPTSTAASKSERRIVALRLAATSDPFPGARLAALFEQAALKHGKYSIYHRLEGERSVFSVASIVEPGTFDPVTLTSNEFPGITMFAVLPGPVDALAAIDTMLATGRHFEQVLGGTLQDERGNLLTPRLVSRLRGEVLEFQQATSVAASS